MARYRTRYRRKKKNKIGRALALLLGICLGLYLLLAADEELSLFPSGGAEPVFADAACAVHFIDVGQGDSALIQSDGKTILIDAGENDQGKTVTDYLKGQGVKRIDLLIMTHPHSDHIGGMDTVIEGFEIGQIVMPRLPEEQVPATKTYTDVLTAIAEKGLKITPARVGDEYAFGRGTVTLLGPLAEYGDLNDFSVVCRFEYAGKRFLFTGDMEERPEADLLEAGSDLRADVLKVGHHGSKTSTSPAFYRAVDPQICVISVGEGNSYGHPSEETLQTIASNGARICRTDYQGSIIIEVAEEGLSVITEGNGKENAA